MECSKVRQDTTLKQEKIPDKKQIDYNTKSQYISPRIKAKRRASTGQNILLILYKFRIKSSKVSPPGSKNLPFICCFDFATASTVTLEINIIISSTESLSIRYYLLHQYNQPTFVSQDHQKTTRHPITHKVDKEFLNIHAYLLQNN